MAGPVPQNSCWQVRKRAHTRGAIEVEEGAGCEVHKLLALAVEIEGDLLRLRPARRWPA